MIIDDREALELGKQISELCDMPTVLLSDVQLVSLGKIAFKLVTALQDKLREDYGG